MRLAPYAALFTLGLACGAGTHLAMPDAGTDSGTWRDAAPDSSPDSSIECAVPDADGDGFAAVPCDGNDCDDQDAAIHPGAFDHSGWTIVQVEDDGHSPALGVGQDGVVHLVYSADAGLRHATGQDDWAPETIDATSTAGASIAVATDGAVHVGYVERMDGPGSNLKYAVRTGDEWTVEGVAQGDSWTTWLGAAVGLSPEGQVHLAYEYRWRENWYQLEVAARTDDDWVVETVAESTEAGARPSITFTTDGTVHLTAFDTEVDDLLHYFRGANGWASEIVDNEVGSGPQEVQPFTAGLVVVYGDGEVASWSDGTWVRDLSQGWYGYGPDLALDTSGDLRLSIVALDYVFDSGELGFVTYATQPAADEWSPETIDRCDGLTTSIALDLEERPYIAYEKGGAMFVAFRDGTLDGIDQNCDGADGDSPAW